MLTIHKFRLAMGAQQVHTATGARLLNVGVDEEGRVCVWAVIDTGAPKATRNLYCAWTGKPLPEDAADGTAVYVGTAMAKHGEVLHVFDRGES